MKQLYALLIFVLCFSCFSPRKREYVANNQKLLLVSEARKKVSAELSEKFGLVSVGSGGQMMHQVEMLMLAFAYNKELNENDARKIVVESVESFTRIVNSDERLRPYLSNFPFEPKNIQVEIYVKAPQENAPSEGLLNGIVARNGLIEYETRDKNTHKLLMIHSESFEEAKNLLQKASIPSNSPM